MTSTKVATVVAWIAIVVLVVHAARAWASQLRWVTAVVELAAAVVIAWLWWQLSRYKPATP